LAAVGLPPDLARGGERVIRPRDAAHIYVQPWSEFTRLANIGALHKVATGYYAIVPLSRIGDRRWKPDLEAVALGIGRADYGTANAVLMGVSAARHHGAVPRPLGVAVVAVPKQRPALTTTVGQVVFVKRDIASLEVERIGTTLGAGWVTTVEQTLIDLAARPSLGDLAEQDVAVAIRSLARRASWPTVERLAAVQHKPRALEYARDAIGA
jgi:hypothetical protein